MASRDVGAVTRTKTVAGYAVVLLCVTMAWAERPPAVSPTGGDNEVFRPILGDPAVSGGVRSGGVTIHVYPSSAPNAFGSPSWSGYLVKALSALENELAVNGNRLTDPTAYERAPAQVSGGEIAVTSFNSWRGQVSPPAPFAGEYGNRMHFGLHAYGDGATLFTLEDLSFHLHSDDLGDSLHFDGDFVGFSYNGTTRYGIHWGANRVKGGGDDVVYTSANGTTPVDEIVYVGVGNAWWPSGGDPQDDMDAYFAWLASVAPVNVSCTYTIGADSGTGSVAVGPHSLTLEADQECYNTGETVTVGVWMNDLAPTIRGGQFFLAYNTTYLSLPDVPTDVSVTPGDAPFTLEIFECSTDHTGPGCTPTAGQIDYSVGVPFGDPGTAGTRKMAVLKFTALAEVCGAANLITWRPHDPPTRLSDDIGEAVYPELLALSLVSIDDTAPMISCPPNTAIDCDDSTLPNSNGFATATDNCDTNASVAYSDAYAAPLLSGGALLSSPAGWGFQSQSTARGNLVSGPGTPPLPGGSFSMTTGAGVFVPGGGGKIWLTTANHNGTLLSSITTFNYTTWVDLASGGPAHLAPAINLYIDLDGNGTRDTTLVFEPVYVVGTQGPVVRDTWQTWDMLNGPGWWYTANFAPLANAFNEFQPLSYYIGLFPSAKIVAWGLDPRGVQIVAGQNSAGAPWQNFSGAVDSLTINATTYDFNPADLLFLCLATLERTWTATDDCGNASSCLQSITISDTTAPAITTPASDMTVECDGAGNSAQLNAWLSSQGGAAATDNCSGVAWSHNFTALSDLCGATGAASVTFTATDGCGNFSSTMATFTIEDTTDPGITCPANVSVDCDDLSDPPATGTASGTDTCGGTPAISYSDNRSGLTGCNATGPILRTWTATDACGNEATCVQTVTMVDTEPPVLTACPSNITTNADAGGCDAVVAYTSPTATDECYSEGFEDPMFVSGAPFVGGAGLHSVNWNDYNSHLSRVASGTDGIPSKSGGFHGVIDSTVLPAPTDDWTGAFTRLRGYSPVFGSGFQTSLDVYIDLADPAVAAQTYGFDLSSAVSNQANAHRRDFIFHAAADDNTNPGMVLVAASNNSSFTKRNDLETINHYVVSATGWYTFEWAFRDFGDGSLAVDCNLRNASGALLWTETRHDAGDILATVVGGNRYMWFTFLAMDKLAIDNTRLIRNVPVVCTPASGSTFLTGTTPVSCVATDACSNPTSCGFNVTVDPFNELVVNVQLSPTMVAGPINRCVTFELWDCPDTAPSAVEPEVLSFSGGLASQTVLIECGAYECITARDRRHTLRRTDESFGIVGTQYVADFTGNPTSGGDWLIGGNLNDDFWIDILDFGAYSFKYGTNYGTGNTTCATLAPHPDINGNGIVGTEDFTFIQINFLKGHEANCCGQAGRSAEEGDGPITRISVRELRQRGLGNLAAGDLNRDGWLDEADITAFLSGVRPRVTPQQIPAESETVEQP